MHASAYALGCLFFHLNGWSGQRILEVGARNVTGSLREACPPGAKWVGVDQEEGSGVDVVAAGSSLPFSDDSFDLVVSSSQLEHDPFFWLTFDEMVRVVKPGGLVYADVPAKGPYHAYPVDCWRFYPDAAEALCRWARRSGKDVVLLESFLADAGQDVWTDLVMVFAKGAAPEGYRPLREAARTVTVSVRPG